MLDPSVLFVSVPDCGVMALVPAHDILKDYGYKMSLLVSIRWIIWWEFANALEGISLTCRWYHRRWIAINMEVGLRVTTKLELSHTR
jgi:hypothetical protein